MPKCPRKNKTQGVTQAKGGGRRVGGNSFIYPVGVVDAIVAAVIVAGALLG